MELTLINGKPGRTCMKGKVQSYVKLEKPVGCSGRNEGQAVGLRMSPPFSGEDCTGMSLQRG